MNLKSYYNLQSTQAIFFIKHTSSLGREEASSSFNSMITTNGDAHHKGKKVVQHTRGKVKPSP